MLKSAKQRPGEAQERTPERLPRSASAVLVNRRIREARVAQPRVDQRRTRQPSIVEGSGVSGFVLASRSPGVSVGRQATIARNREPDLGELSRLRPAKPGRPRTIGYPEPGKTSDRGGGLTPARERRPGLVDSVVVPEAMTGRAAKPRTSAFKSFLASFRPRRSDDSAASSDDQRSVSRQLHSVPSASPPHATPFAPARELIPEQRSTTHRKSAQRTVPMQPAKPLMSEAPTRRVRDVVTEPPLDAAPGLEAGLPVDPRPAADAMPAADARPAADAGPADAGPVSDVPTFHEPAPDETEPEAEAARESVRDSSVLDGRSELSLAELVEQELARVRAQGSFAASAAAPADSSDSTTAAREPIDAGLAEPVSAAIEGVGPAEPEAAVPDAEVVEVPPEAGPATTDVAGRASGADPSRIDDERRPGSTRGPSTSPPARKPAVYAGTDAGAASMARSPNGDVRDKRESKAIELKATPIVTSSPTASGERAPVTIAPTNGSVGIQQFVREPPSKRDVVLRWGAFIIAAVSLALIVTEVALFLTRTSSPSSSPNQHVTAGAGSRAGFPAGAPFLGSYISSQVMANGDVVTDQWISLANPVSEIAVSTRPLVAGSNDFTPNIKEIRVDLNGRRIKTEVASFDTKTLSLGLPRAARYIHVHYVTTGVAISSAQSPKGRALVLINGLVVGGMPDSASDVVTTNGDQVLSMTCQKANQPPVPCGSQNGTTWSVRLSDHPSDIRVIAQVNLKN